MNEYASARRSVGTECNRSASAREGEIARGRGRSLVLRFAPTVAARPRRPKSPPAILSNSVGSSTNPAPPNKKGPEKQALFYLAVQGGNRSGTVKLLNFKG